MPAFSFGLSVVTRVSGRIAIKKFACLPISNVRDIMLLVSAGCLVSTRARREGEEPVYMKSKKLELAEVVRMTVAMNQGKEKQLCHFLGLTLTTTRRDFVT